MATGNIIYLVTRIEEFWPKYMTYESLKVRDYMQGRLANKRNDMNKQIFKCVYSLFNLCFVKCFINYDQRTRMTEVINE